jgi:hypothetical protein
MCTALQTIAGCVHGCAWLPVPACSCLCRPTQQRSLGKGKPTPGGSSKQTPGGKKSSFPGSGSKGGFPGSSGGSSGGFGGLGDLFKKGGEKAAGGFGGFGGVGGGSSGGGGGGGGWNWGDKGECKTRCDPSCLRILSLCHLHLWPSQKEGE